jgi:hypothetical protein
VATYGQNPTQPKTGPRHRPDLKTRQATSGLTTRCSGRGHRAATAGATARLPDGEVARERWLKHWLRAADPPVYTRRPGTQHSGAATTRGSVHTAHRRNGGEDAQ